MTIEEFRAELRALVRQGWEPKMLKNGQVFLEVPDHSRNGHDPFLSPLAAVSYAKSGIRTKATWIAAGKIGLGNKDEVAIVVATSDHAEISRWDEETKTFFLSLREDLLVDCELVTQ